MIFKSTAIPHMTPNFKGCYGTPTPWKMVAHITDILVQGPPNLWFFWKKSLKKATYYTHSTYQNMGQETPIQKSLKSPPKMYQCYFSIFSKITPTFHMGSASFRFTPVETNIIFTSLRIIPFPRGPHIFHDPPYRKLPQHITLVGYLEHWIPWSPLIITCVTG